MADDDQDRTREAEAERRAEIESEMERVDQNPEQVEEGSDTLGTQSADSGSPREEEDVEERPEDAATNQEEAQELPDDQQAEQWEAGDEELSEDVHDADDEE